MTKSKNNNLNNDSWPYILLLTTIIILLEAIKPFQFSLLQIKLSYTIFILPLIYFISNYITKNYGFKKTIDAIAISSFLFISFTSIISFSLGEKIVLSNIGAELFAYIISQLINLMVYTFLYKNTKSPYLLLYINYLFSLVVYYMIYTIINLKIITLDTYWSKYFITIGIQSFICLGLTYLDKKNIEDK